MLGQQVARKVRAIRRGTPPEWRTGHDCTVVIGRRNSAEAFSRTGDWWPVSHTMIILTQRRRYDDAMRQRHHHRSPTSSTSTLPHFSPKTSTARCFQHGRSDTPETKSSRNFLVFFLKYFRQSNRRLRRWLKLIEGN